MTKATITTADAFFANASEAGVDLFNPQTMINSTLRHDEQLRYDEKLQMIARQRLNGIKDLQAAGLVVDIGGFGTTMSMYERAGDMIAATSNMDGMVDARNDRLTFDEVGVPIPVTQVDFQLGKRQLLASRTRGEPLSTSQIAIAGRLVSDGLESMLFNGLPDFEVSGNRIYGYTNYPQRNTINIGSDGWKDKTADGIIADVKNMLDMAYADNRFGPFTIYVAKDIWAHLQTDYSTQKGDNTIMQRILAFVDITAVRPGDSMANGNVVMVQMTEDVIDLAVGQDMINIEFGTNPMQTMYKVYAAMAPRVKSDKNGSCGIVHGVPQ